MLIGWLRRKLDPRPTKTALDKRLRAECGYSRNQAKQFVHDAGKLGLTKRRT